MDIDANGYWVSNAKAVSGGLLQNCFQQFLQRELPYRLQFLQKYYSRGFDGYSYAGQEDSTNQYASDMLHSMVLSDFCDHTHFPEEFHAFFTRQWDWVMQSVQKIELDIIQQLAIPDLLDFYQENMRHMFSCNYYPITQQRDRVGSNPRLSAHTDVSLFTVFPFGFDSDFQYQTKNGSWASLEATDTIVLFPGYFLEYWTNGRIKALHHKVKLPEGRACERFSFSCFSIPHPEKEFVINGKQTSGERYFEKYLALFST